MPFTGCPSLPEKCQFVCFSMPWLCSEPALPATTAAALSLLRGGFVGQLRALGVALGGVTEARGHAGVWLGAITQWPV